VAWWQVLGSGTQAAVDLVHGALGRGTHGTARPGRQRCLPASVPALPASGPRGLPQETAATRAPSGPVAGGSPHAPLSPANLPQRWGVPGVVRPHRLAPVRR